MLHGKLKLRAELTAIAGWTHPESAFNFGFVMEYIVKYFDGMLYGKFYYSYVSTRAYIGLSKSKNDDVNKFILYTHGINGKTVGRHIFKIVDLLIDVCERASKQ